jgi:hypothetical protein
MTQVRFGFDFELIFFFQNLILLFIVWDDVMDAGCMSIVPVGSGCCLCAIINCITTARCCRSLWNILLPRLEMDGTKHTRIFMLYVGRR